MKTSALNYQRKLGIYNISISSYHSYFKATLVTGWLLCVVAVCVIELSIMPYLDEKFVPANGNSVFPVVYGVFHRLAWAGVPAWTIFTCANGYGGNNLFKNKLYLM